MAETAFRLARRDRLHRGSFRQVEVRYTVDAKLVAISSCLKLQSSSWKKKGKGNVGSGGSTLVDSPVRFCGRACCFLSISQLCLVEMLGFTLRTTCFGD